MPRPAAASPAASPARPVTIVFAHEGLDWIRGSERCLLDLVARLDPARFRCAVICTAPTLAREAAHLGVETIRVDSWGTGPVRSAAVRGRTREQLRSVDAALVHANMPGVIPAVLPAARALRLPVVAHQHIPLSPAERWHTLYHQVDVAVGVARHVVAMLPEEGMPPERVRVIPNAVDEARLSAGDATGLRGGLGIPASACVVASVGSLIHRKGHDLSIEAVAAARARGADVHLLVCGDGEEAGPLRARAAERGVDGAVHFLGLRGDVGAVLRDATDVYVSAARGEALPLNVLEAQWAGLPVVCSDIEAHREALVPGRTGVLVPTEDAGAVADAVLALAGDAERRRVMGAAGRALVAERFSMARYVGAFSALYDELLARPRANYGWLRAGRWPRTYTRWVTGVVGRRLERLPLFR